MNFQKSVMGQAGANKREDRANLHNVNVNEIQNKSGKKSNSSCGVRAKDIKNEALKLYNRSDKSRIAKDFDTSNSVGRNNAYNSLTDCYKVGTMNEQMTAEWLMQNQLEMSKACSTSFNGTNISDLNDMVYPNLAQTTGNMTKSEILNHTSGGSNRNMNPKSPYNVSSKQNEVMTSSKKRSIESEPKEISTNVPNTYHSDTRYRMQLPHGGKNEDMLRAQLLNAKNEIS